MIKKSELYSVAYVLFMDNNCDDDGVNSLFVTIF